MIKITKPSITLGITIATYQRPDGKTPEYLKKTLSSICNQSYQNFKIFIVGDNYENNNEFESILNSFDALKNKLIYENLSYAKERDKYLDKNHALLWCTGGVNALNYANNLARLNNITNICHIDHDDYWRPNHLELIANAITEKQNPAFLYTLSVHVNSPIYPFMIPDGQIVESFPLGCTLIHSSIYMDLEQLPLEYRDVFELEGRVYPADADMLDRIRILCQQKQLGSYVIKEVTCVHVMEQT